MDESNDDGAGAAGAADLEAFAAAKRAEGCDALIERRWEPGLVVETHAHPFAAHALVTDGEMWLTCGETTQHLRRGDTFRLALGEPHSERYGPEGATYWVARTHS